MLHGQNGQGKTNILEAVGMLAMLRAFREPRPALLIRHGQERARVIGVIQGDQGTRELRWSWAREGRRIAIDEQPTRELGQWFSLIRAVLFSPDQLSIVRGGPAERRRFVDRAAFTARPGHLEVVRGYQRVLRQKAALLRAPHGTAADLEPWNEQLAVLGARLVVRRQLALDELSEPLDALHSVVGGVGALSLRMKGVGALSQVHDGEPALAQALADLLMARADAELERGRVLVGPHRDELDLRLDDQPARSFASQGQARTIVLALKLAELEVSRRRGQSPLFLLDDLTGELDHRRMGMLIERLAELENQVWLTTTDPGHLGPLPSTSVAQLRVQEGKVETG